MFQALLCVGFLTAVWQAALGSDGSYLITAPNEALRGSIYDVTVDILNTTDVAVEAVLARREFNGTTNRYDITPIERSNGVFGRGNSGTLSIPIPADLSLGFGYQLRLRGRNGLQFERSVSLRINREATQVFIQTDKAMYKPRQTVRFRAFAIYPDLVLYSGLLDVEIRDSNGNKIKVWKGLETNGGVIEESLQLSDQPLFGDWVIVATVPETEDNLRKTFTVADFQLPRFEVTVELPPYALTRQASLNGKVKAMYTFGQPVKGMVELQVSEDTGNDRCGQPPKHVEIAFEVDGEAQFSFPTEDIGRVTFIRNNKRIRVTAFVKETNTGVRLNGSSVVTFYDNEYRVEFLENTPSVFKPGLPYVAFVRVSTPDGMPPTGFLDEVAVYTEVTYRLDKLPDQGFYPSNSFTGTYPIPGQNFTLPVSGVLPVAIDIPSNATEIRAKATYRRRSAEKRVEKTFSRSENYLQVSLLDQDVKAGGNATFKIITTEPLDTAAFIILARGCIAQRGTIQANGEMSTTHTMMITPFMAPTAHLVVYYFRDENNEVVADSLAFNVEGIFNNEVSVDFNVNRSMPNENVDILVTADADSVVNLLAVDQSVLLLKSGNDITPKVVGDALAKYGQGRRPSDSTFALSYSSRSPDEVFRQTGLMTITDVTLSAPRALEAFAYASPRRHWGPGVAYDAGPPGMSIQSNYHATESDSTKLKEVERVRAMFPETWIWNSSIVGPEGRVSLAAQVPDTITSWIASAFATNVHTGLGVAPATAKLEVFRPFFVSLNMPNSVLRGEQLVIQATVFNYLPRIQNVRVTLVKSSGFDSVVIRPDGTETTSSRKQVQRVRVRSDEQVTVYFPVTPTTLGSVDVEVRIQSSNAADAVRRQILVEPEGVPVTFNYPVFVSLRADAGNNVPLAVHEQVDLTLPQNFIQGSEKAQVKITGDLLGPSLFGLDSLISLPTGCGEQNMVKFAPDVYIARYLEATGQLSESIMTTITEYLESGYQRQLTYQRSDGGFSAFGNNDEAGSTWLTAFVGRVFSEASSYTFIDDNILKQTMRWLVDRQNRDGSFNEFGRLLDTRTQGTEGPALTSFVLLALLQNRGLALNNARETQNFVNVTQKAVVYLERSVPTMDDLYTLAITSYALSLVKSELAGEAFSRLQSKATVKAGVRYWTTGVTKNEANLFWRPPRVQAPSTDIHITSYALLAHAARGQFEEGLDVVRWLAKQRNPNGGFASTQDTIVALLALSDFASKATEGDYNINADVTTNTGETVQYSITRENALVLKVQQFREFPQTVDFGFSGTGLALAEVSGRFHIEEELSNPAFDVSTVLLDDDVDSFNLMVCTKWQLSGKSGMVVQEISIPSGFEPDLASVANVAGMKRSERQGNVVAFYFDEIGKTSLCYSIMMNRNALVAHNQQAYVVTYDYYEPANQATVFYHPKELRDASVCDVCDRCCA